MKPVFYVIAISLQDKTERRLSSHATREEAEVALSYTIARRGVESEFFTIVERPA